VRWLRSRNGCGHLVLGTGPGALGPMTGTGPWALGPAKGTGPHGGTGPESKGGPDGHGGMGVMPGDMTSQRAQYQTKEARGRATTWYWLTSYS